MITNTKRPFLVVLTFLLSVSFLSASTNLKKHWASAVLSPAGATPAACVGGPVLSGTYGFLAGGDADNGNGGKYLSGAITFDGNCNVSANNMNGGINGKVVNSTMTGTYGQNTDGTFTIVMNLSGDPVQQTYVVGVSESGNKARGIESDSTAGATVDIQSQFTNLASGYSKSSLAGTYAAACHGVGVEFDYVTFDGNGNVAGLNTTTTAPCRVAAKSTALMR